jgi:hypothetical protein
MMDAREEAISLRDNPLPPEPVTRQLGDEILPSRILALDKQIRDYEEGLALAREAKEVLIQRAVSLGIGEDSEAVILRREKNLPREININLFKGKYPAIYETAKQTEITYAREQIQKKIDALDTAGTAIRLKTLEPLMNKSEIDSVCFPHRIVTTYEVQNAKLPLPKGQVRKLLE